MYFAICIIIDPNSQILTSPRCCCRLYESRSYDIWMEKNSIARNKFHQNPSWFEVSRQISPPL